MRTRRIVPVITVPDLAAARELYVEMLGLEEVMNHGWILTLAAPGHELSLITTDATAAVNPSVSVEVDDVDEAYRIARAAGATIRHELTDEEWGVRRFFVEDAAGTVVNVLSHRG